MISERTPGLLKGVQWPGLRSHSSSVGLEGDAGRAVQMAHQAKVTNAELERSDVVGRLRPLNAEASNEATVADICAELVHSLPQPYAKFGRAGGGSDVDAAVEEEVS
jgi:hypothetical protein